MTVYAEDTTNAPVISTVGSNATEKYDMPAYNTDNIEYKDAEGAALQNKAVGTIDAVYATVKVNNAPGTISEGNGLTMYIDGLTLANFGREPTTSASPPVLMNGTASDATNNTLFICTPSLVGM